MRRRRLGLSLAVLALAAASLAPKLPPSLAAQPQSRPAAAVTDVLERSGFAVRDVTSDPDLVMLSAQAPGCRVLVGLVAPQGWHRDVIRQMTPPGARLAYVVDGALLPEQPVWRTRARRMAVMVRRHLGAQIPVPAVYAVTAEPGCRLDALPWADLAWADLAWADLA